MANETTEPFAGPFDDELYEVSGAVAHEFPRPRRKICPPHYASVASMSEALSILYGVTWPKATALLVPYDQSLEMWRLHLMVTYGMPYAVIARRIREGKVVPERLGAVLAADMREVVDSLCDGRAWRSRHRNDVIGSVVCTGHAEMLGTPKWNPPDYPVEPWAGEVGRLGWLAEPGDALIDAYLGWLSDRQAEQGSWAGMLPVADAVREYRETARQPDGTGSPDISER